MSVQTLQTFLALLLGFAVAGMISSFYQLLTSRPPSFHLLGQGPRAESLAAIPLLVFAAPFIIMRNTILGCLVENRRFESAMLATVIAGFWSLCSGTVVLMAVRALGDALA